MKLQDFASLRREYYGQALSELNLDSDPFVQFYEWFSQASQSEADPAAMTVATVDEALQPNLRVVLLKEISNNQFIFYTHYNSAKGEEILHNPSVALNFFWHNAVRQVRIRGTATLVSHAMSERYFQSRPRASQISALASNQSHVIPSREVLEARVHTLENEYADSNAIIACPKTWGGYAVAPKTIEFWQGREDRLHDRVRYRRENQAWILERLAP